MRINGSFSCDVDEYRIKRNKAHDGKTALVDIEFSVDQEQATRKIGAQFALLAFSSMYMKKADPNNPDAVDKICHLQDSIKPNSNVVFERHVIEVGGIQTREQPQLLNIHPIDGEARALVSLRLALEVAIAKSMKLDDMVNETITVAFNPEQQSLPLPLPGEGNGNGHGGEDADDGTAATSADA